MPRSPSSFPALGTLLCTAALALGATAPAQARGRLHFNNGAGTGGAVASGPRGVMARGHTIQQNADGSVTSASGGGFVGANGARGYRGGTTTQGADGSLTRSGSAGVSGARGSAQSSGSFSRSADGTWSGSRSSSATSSATGKSYSGSTTIDPTTGKPVHSGGCTDASGQSVACH